MSLFLKMCRGEPCERKPIWIMRQAGRYLPEYRELRSRASFLDVCQNADLAAEVTLQPLRRFGFDAAIIFSDIMVPLLSMGVKLEFQPGPVLATPIASNRDIDNLRVVEEEAIAPAVMEAIRLVRQATQTPLIGFAGAPWTLAAYLIEGKGGKDFPRIRSWLHSCSSSYTLLMEKLTAMTIGYLKQQIQHGAQAIQLFDSWAGLLSLAEYQRWVLPWNQKIINALKDHAVPKIFFAYGATHLLPLLSQIKANVIGLDWRTCLVDARKYLGDHYTLQGNLDPAILLTNPQVVHAKALELANLKLGSHIINLGHGILPETPIENVQALVDGVRYAANNQS